MNRKLSIIALGILIGFSSFAQKLKKADRSLLTNLKAHIGYLADDKLQGRRTGTPGEQLALDYISNQFQQIGLQPRGTQPGSFAQPFQVNEGKQINPATHLLLNGHDLKLNTEYFPFPFSPNTSVEAAATPALKENGSPWFYNLAEALAAAKTNPHFDLLTHILETTKAAADKGATALLIYNSSAINDELQFNGKDKSPLQSIPVCYITKDAAGRYFKDEAAIVDLKIKTAIGDKIRTGQNAVGYIDNGAATTVILGAHFDHLGMGEDGNSRHTGHSAEIHNGADDNASGSAALIELARFLKNSKARNNNYLFIAFSGEELGLYGSKYFTEHPTVPIGNANYMINMDMVGRLSDSSRALTIGGFGTSPAWPEVINTNDKFFTIKIDSSGTGPSDHTSFYRKDIPVLFFFTGLHTDYHTPTDDFDKVNYTGELFIVKYIAKLIETLNTKGKLSFTKTREQQVGTNTRFKVTMGIMPDYTFSGEGVRADGVSEGKPAQKAGIRAGDIVLQIGDYPTRSMDEYMKALGKFAKGDSAAVRVKRGNEEIKLTITF
jgi:aminopeptidase YwaD